MAENKFQNFTFRDIGAEGLKLISPFYAKDDRGYFIKSFEEKIFVDHGISFHIDETFETRSKKNIVRGMHFQTVQPQSKLITISVGRIYDVAVDLRKNSETYGKWFGFELSEEQMNAFFIPSGFAHGFISLSDISVVNYKCEGEYLKEYDTGIVWNDPVINIKWPIEETSKIVTSTRDAALMTFEEFDKKYGGL